MTIDDTLDLFGSDKYKAKRQLFQIAIDMDEPNLGLILSLRSQDLREDAQIFRVLENILEDTLELQLFAESLDTAYLSLLYREMFAGQVVQAELTKRLETIDYSCTLSATQLLKQKPPGFIEEVRALYPNILSLSKKKYTNILQDEQSQKIYKSFKRALSSFYTLDNIFDVGAIETGLVYPMIHGYSTANMLTLIKAAKRPQIAKLLAELDPAQYEKLYKKLYNSAQFDSAKKIEFLKVSHAALDNFPVFLDFIKPHFNHDMASITDYYNNINTKSFKILNNKKMEILATIEKIGLQEKITKDVPKTSYKL